MDAGWKTLVLLVCTVLVPELSQAEEIYERVLFQNKSVANLLHWTNISITTGCHKDYHNSMIIEKCLNSTEKHLLEDIFRLIPVTLKTGNFTYRNAYCALCNNHQNYRGDFVFWKLVFSYQTNDTSRNNFVKVDKMEILSNLNYSGGSLVAWFDGFEGKTDVRLHHLCTWRPGNQEKGHGQLTVGNYSQHRPSCINKKFCPSLNLTSLSKDCKYFYEMDRFCSRNDFLVEGFDFMVGENEEMIITMGQFNRTTYKKDCGIEGVTFLCGDAPIDVWKIPKLIFRLVSMTFLTAFLIINPKKGSLNILSNIVLYSYCVTVFVLCVYNEFMDFIESCTMKYSILVYLVFANAFWTIATFCEFWRVILRSFMKRVTFNRTYLRIYLMYCAFGWILPAASTWLYMWYNDEATAMPTYCPKIEGYLYCRQNYVVNLATFSGVIFILLAPLVFVPAACFVYLVNKNTFEAVIKRVFIINLTRATSSAAFYWLVMAVCSAFWGFAKGARVTSTGFLCAHGVFIFFAFCFTRNMWNGILKKCNFQTTTVTRRTEIEFNNEQIVIPLVEDVPQEPRPPPVTLGR